MVFTRGNLEMEVAVLRLFVSTTPLDLDLLQQVSPFDQELRTPMRSGGVQEARVSYSGMEDEYRRKGRSRAQDSIRRFSGPPDVAKAWDAVTVGLVVHWK